MKNGQWTKAIGGDFGEYYKSGQWHRFECIGCMFANGLLKPSDRIQGRNPSNKLNQMPVEHRHDPKIHGDWLKAGKPIQK